MSWVYSSFMLGFLLGVFVMWVVIGIVCWAASQ